MPNLTDALQIASRAMDAQRLGLEVTGHNIANVNTPAYARRVIDLRTRPPLYPGAPGTGVDVAGVRALRDSFVERRLLEALPGEGRERVIAETLSAVEALLGRPGESIDGALTDFFDGFAALVDDPTSTAARVDVIARGQALANAFRSAATNFGAAQHDADLVARDAVGEINTLAGRIAELNRSIAETIDPSSKAFFLDEQHQVLDRLAELIDVGTMSREDGGVDVTFGNGRSLVIGVNPHDLAISSGAGGLVVLQSDGATVTSEITSGRLGGALHVRDVLVPDYLDRLDTIAYEVVEEVNALHDAGFDLDGNDAGVFFTVLGAPGGAAAAIAVDPTLAANPRLVGAAGTASPGDNQTARAIADLRDGLVLDGGLSTLNDKFAELMRRVGGDARTAQDGVVTARDYLTQMQNLRDAASGVSLDEEAVMMVKFQRAFEANARFFTVIDQLSELLMRTLGA